MNEKIKQLALKAGIGLTLWDDSGREMIDNYTPEEYLDDFAHLIIEECAKLAEYQGYNQAFGLGGLRTKLHEYFEISRSDE